MFPIAITILRTGRTICLTPLNKYDVINTLVLQRRTLVAVALFSNAAYCGEYVQLAKGTVKGELAKSRDGRRYYSFTGVPFAKPPVGDLRFEVV